MCRPSRIDEESFNNVMAHREDIVKIMNGEFPRSEDGMGQCCWSPWSQAFSLGMYYYSKTWKLRGVV